MQPFVFVTVSSAAYARKENSVLTNKTGQSNIFLGCNENYNQNNFKKNGNTLGVNSNFRPPIEKQYIAET